MKVRSLFRNLSMDVLTKSAVFIGIVGVVTTTIGDVVARIRHDRREDKLYATLTLKASEVSTNIFGNVDLMNEIREKEEA